MLAPLCLCLAISLPSSQAAVPASAQRSVQSPDSEAIEFAHQIAWTLSEEDGSLVLAAMDYKALLEDIVEELGAPPTFLTEMVHVLREDEPFANTILDDSIEAVRYHCVRVEYESDRLIATFRHRPSSGLEYHRYWLVPTDEDVFRIRDVELIASGENWSDRVRVLAQERWTAGSQSRLEALSEFDRLRLEHRRHYAKIHEALARLDGRAALEVLEELPDVLRRSRSGVALMLEAARRVTDAPFAQIHRAANDAFPGDAGIDLFAWRHAEELGDPTAILVLHSRLSESLSADGYRDAVAASAYRQRGDPKSAAIYAERAVAREPGLESAWNVLLDVTLDREDYPRVREILRVLQNQFGRQIDLRRDPRFRRYLASEEFSDAPARR